MSNNLPPLVSIVLATYNGGTFLQEQLDSLLEQTYTNIEIIAVDDGSTDNTLNILNAYAAKHAHIKVHAGNNVGYIKNFERGCRLAGGAYISLCDQDDKWEKEKIALMMEAIGEHPLVFCDSIVCDERLNDTGKRISTFANFQSRYHCTEISVFCRIYGNATLFTKALFTAADPFLEVIPHDWWISYVATLHGGIKYLDKQLVYYRQHSANVIGAVGGSKPKKDKQAKKEKKKAEIAGIRKRMQVFAEICPAKFKEDKKILEQLAVSYQSFSLLNNLRRMITFFRYRTVLLGVKKRSLIRQYLFCLKMFVMVK